MKQPRYFDSRDSSREALKTRILIADIDRVVQILNSDIAAEEQQTGVFDRCHSEYPMLARTLAARRDNLKGTMAALERRISDPLV